MISFVCEPGMDGMLTAIYEIWDWCDHHRTTPITDSRIEIRGEYEPEFFCEYIEVLPDPDKAQKVARSIRTKVSEDIWEHCYKALCSTAADRADAVYRFLRLAFRIGDRILYQYGDPVVMRVFELRRAVSQEMHLLLGFTRFEEYPGGILAAKIAPKNDVIEFLAVHFQDRLSEENWILYDEKRLRYIAYAKERGLLFGRGALELFAAGMRSIDAYPDLWKTFFEHVTIPERENYVCQRSHLPLYLRTNMTEFQP